MLLWRVSNHADLDGRGGLLASARWHSEGRPIVYLAESPAAAMLEVLVHLELDVVFLPPTYKLLKIEAPDTITVREVRAELPQSWQSKEVVTRTIGDDWLASRATALLRVPSAIVPESFNVLLNPAHPDAKLVKIRSQRDYPWDKRLLE